MVNRNCPECNRTMSKEVHNGVSLDKCNSCAGIFLDFGEMKELTEKVNLNKIFEKIQKGDFLKDNVGKDIKCSNCSEIMEEREYIYGSGNHINFCTSCGSIYLDKGELKQIQDFEISRRNSREGKKLLEEIELKGLKISNKQKAIIDNLESNQNDLFELVILVLKKIIFR